MAAQAGIRGKGVPTMQEIPAGPVKGFVPHARPGPTAPHGRASVFLFRAVTVGVSPVGQLHVPLGFTDFLATDGADQGMGHMGIPFVLPRANWKDYVNTNLTV